MDNYTHYIKKSIIPVSLVFLGIYLLILGVKDIKNYTEPQDSSFIYGAFCSLLMGIFILIINFELINSKIIKKITLPISLIILLPFAGHLSYSIYYSINNTINEMDQKKMYDSNIQQGLNDIKDIQIKYKKVYGWYSDDYNELKRFLLEDKYELIKLIPPKGLNEDSIYNLIDKPISAEHQILLKYDSTDINDWKKILDGYDDDEALDCKLLIKDTTLTAVMSLLFPEDQNVKYRAFPFNIDEFQYVPSFDFHTNDKTQFSLKTDIYKNIGNNDYNFLYYNKKNNHFVSSHLVNWNKKFNHLYNKKGLILLQDSILGDKNLKKGDILTSLNNLPLENPSDIRNILIELTLKDTLRLQFSRYDKSKSEEKVEINLNVELASISINRTQNMNYWINDLQTSFSAIVYNPTNYIIIPIETKFLTKADESSLNGSNMYLDTASINKLSNYRDIFKEVSYEYERGKFYSNKDSITSPLNVFTKSKKGTAVFLIEDPNPYDPFNKCPLPWKIGSLKEIKTNGNWD